MVVQKKFINSIILVILIITSGTYSIIEPLRYIEIIAPIILLFFLILNRFIIQNDIIFKLLILLFFFIFLRTLIDLNSQSLFAFRFLSSIIIFLSFFLLSSQNRYFTLYPVTFFLLLVLLFEIEVYKYFWEFSYLFSISLVTLLFFNNYVFVFFNLLMLFSLGQRTILLVIIYLFTKFFNLNINFKIFFNIIILILLTLVIFSYLNLNDRLFSIFKNLDISGYVDTFLLFLQDAPNYSYNDFLNENRRDTLLLSKELFLDFSLLLRFQKWSHAMANSNIITFLFGLGPGYFGKGADSGWLRLFFEYGILIFIIILFLIYKLINKSNPIQKTIFVVFIIFNFFVDIMFAPLLMGFTGFILGLTKDRNEIFNK
jgi:hypothetical protein